MTRWKMGVAGLIALMVMLGLAYCSGVRRGATDARLSINAEQLKQSDDSVKTVQTRTDSARKHSDVLIASRAKIRDPIRVVADTVWVSDSLDVEDAFLIPQVASLIMADDSTIAALRRSLSLQDTLAAARDVGLSLRDRRISLLEHAKRPRFSHGVQLGVGMCRTATNQQPCIYVGYGVEFRLP